jgi:hypothetical protein
MLGSMESQEQNGQRRNWIYSTISLMQQWRPLLETKKQDLIHIVYWRIKKVVVKLAL